VKKVSVGLVRRDPPLEHHPARARPGEPVAVPGGFGRVAVTSGTGGVEKVGEVICFRTIYASAVPTWRNSSNTASRARARAAAYADGSALPGTAPTSDKRGTTTTMAWEPLRSCVDQGIATVEGVERLIAAVGSSQHLRNPTAHIGSSARSFRRPSPESLILEIGAAVPLPPLPANDRT
jgi:hypothetical protein